MSQHHPLSAMRKNLKHSLATYASALDPLGLDLFLTEILSLHSFHFIGCIHPYFTCPLWIPHSLAATQSLQNLNLEGSRMALHLNITNTPSNTSTYKQTMEIN